MNYHHESPKEARVFSPVDGQLGTTTIGQHTANTESLDVGTTYKLKIISKKLASGKCQVKFYASQSNQRSLYGYTLVEAQATLKDVVESITRKLDHRQQSDNYDLRQMYSLAREEEDDATNFMIFD